MYSEIAMFISLSLSPWTSPPHYSSSLSFSLCLFNTHSNTFFPDLTAALTKFICILTVCRASLCPKHKHKPKSLCAHKERAISVPQMGWLSATANTLKHTDAYLITAHTCTEKTAKRMKPMNAYHSVMHCNPEANKRQIFSGRRAICWYDKYQFNAVRAFE